MVFKIGKKESLVIAVVMAIILVMAAVAFYPRGGGETNDEIPSELDEKDPIITTNHMVMGELFISPTCGNCSYPVQYMGDMDGLEGKVITITHMTGKISGADEWYHQLRNGTVFPDAEFDGRYRSVIGNQSEKDFRNRAMECFTRPVPWVNLDVSVENRSEGYVAVIKGQLPAGSIEGNLRVYLVDKYSTEITTSDGRPIHNLVVDYLRSTDVVFKTTKATTIEVPIDVPVTSEMAVVGVFYVTDYYANGGEYIHSVQADMADIPV